MKRTAPRKLKRFGGVSIDSGRVLRCNLRNCSRLERRTNFVGEFVGGWRFWGLRFDVEVRRGIEFNRPLKLTQEKDDEIYVDSKVDQRFRSRQDAERGIDRRDGEVQPRAGQSGNSGRCGGSVPQFQKRRASQIRTRRKE